MFKKTIFDHWVNAIPSRRPAGNKLVQGALLSQRGRAMLRVCIASIQNVERSLLLLVVWASDIPQRTIKFFSVLFSSAYSSMLEAVTTNIRCMVSSRLCDLHCMVVGKCFWHFAHPAIFDSQLLDQNRHFCLYPTCNFDAPVRGFPSEYRHPVWYGKTRMVWIPDGEKISKICLFVLT